MPIELYEVTIFLDKVFQFVSQVRVDGSGEHIQPIDAGIVLVFPQNRLPDLHVQRLMIFS